MSRDPVFNDLESLWHDRDPVPDGLVDRMRAVVAAEIALSEADLDYELMLLVERSTELSGTRGTGMAYTLRFAGDDLDLLVRVAAGNGDGITRLDGWIVPPAPVAVRATRVGGAERTWQVEVDPQGRFEFADLPTGLYRLWLAPHDDDAKPFGTPAFEI